MELLEDLVPWLDDDEEKALEKHILALHVAATQVGQVETGWNTGPMVDRFLASTGLKPGYAWCASFVYWSLRRAGVSALVLPERWKAPAVRHWYGWAKLNGRLRYTPERGMLGFWLDKNGQGHIFWVRSYNAKTGEIGTIEGNTNFAGSREGDGVYRKVRTMRELASHNRFGFIHLGGLA